MDSLEAARQDENRWPEWQLLWRLHPVSQWLDDRVLARFQRHEAPVLQVARGLSRGERAFLFQGVISNRRSQPALVEWFGVRFQSGAPPDVEPLSDLLAATGLAGAPPNPEGGLDPGLVTQLERLRVAAVEAARKHMGSRRLERAEQLGEALRDNHRKLAGWRDASLQRCERKREQIRAQGRSLRHDEERRIAGEESEVKKTFAERERWVKEAMSTVEEPYLRIALVLVPREG